MKISVNEESAAELEQYAAIPIAFEVMSYFAVRAVESGLSGLLLVEEPVALPWWKDYDAYDSEGPLHWQEHFDMTRWGILAAYAGSDRIGGAVIAWDTPGVDMLEGRSDLAVLWDLRVLPARRGRGVGHLLFQAAEEWARARGCRDLDIETQNVNVPACRFYARQGCELKAVRRGVYHELPDEVQLLWHKPLSGE